MSGELHGAPMQWSYTVAAGISPRRSPTTGAGKAYGTSHQEHDVSADDDKDTLAGLRAAAEAGKAAQARAAELEKQLLFARAGIDTDTKIGKLLFNSWDGDVNDVAGLRTEALEVGAIKVDDGAGEPTPQQADASQQDFRTNLGGGAAGGGNTDPGPDPYEQTLREFHDDRAKGMRRNDAADLAIAKVLSAASNGDKRVLYNEREWRAKNPAKSS